VTRQVITVTTARGHLNRTTMNLIRFNRRDGNVFVSVLPRDNHAWLIVADSGTGISADDQPRVFERFYRADRSRTLQDGQSTGLGLSIAFEIIAAHGGGAWTSRRNPTGAQPSRPGSRCFLWSK
jgi:two-component system phosphate regulon sensor histidine kinase PhoR